MFVDEKTGVRIHADLDETVIRATLRTQDLLPAFLDVIRNTAEYVQITQSNVLELGVITDPAAGDDDERWDSEYMTYFLNEELFDTLNMYAPEGYYFGAHEGDGSDFGYWKIEEL
jgi:hypothetical protein